MGKNSITYVFQGFKHASDRDLTLPRRSPDHIGPSPKEINQSLDDRDLYHERVNTFKYTIWHHANIISNKFIWNNKSNLFFQKNKPFNICIYIKYHIQFQFHLHISYFISISITYQFHFFFLSNKGFKYQQMDVVEY